MIRKRMMGALATASAVLAVLAGTPGAAQAGGTDYLYAFWQAPGSDTSGGFGVFYTYGEIVQVQDWHADGWRTWAQAQKLLPDSNGVLHWVDHSTPCWDDTSHGDTDGGSFTTCNYSIAEGVTVRVHTWATNSGVHRYDSYSPSRKA